MFNIAFLGTLNVKTYSVERINVKSKLFLWLCKCEIIVPFHLVLSGFIWLKDRISSLTSMKNLLYSLHPRKF